MAKVESPVRRRRRSTDLEMARRDIEIARASLTRLEGRLRRLEKVAVAAKKLKEVL